MKIKTLNKNGDPEVIVLTVGEHYKVVATHGTFYVWPADYYGAKHVHVAEDVTGDDLSKIIGAATFRLRHGNEVQVTEWYSGSLNGTPAQHVMHEKLMDQLLERLNMKYYEETF